MTLSPKLEELCMFLRNIPTIHSGGCAIAALAMYNVAKKEGYQAAIVFAYTDWYTSEYRANERYLNGDEGAGVHGCTHVFILLNGITLDCKGLVSISNYDNWHVVTEDFTKKAIADMDNWNKDFKRHIYVPQINNFLKSRLLGDDAIYSEMDEFSDMREH